MTLLETKANEVISKLRECSELKSPSGRSRNEILDLLEQLREIANKYTGRGSLFEIFLSYNITLAEAFCSNLHRKQEIPSRCLNSGSGSPLRLQSCTGGGNGAAAGAEVPPVKPTL